MDISKEKWEKEPHLRVRNIFPVSIYREMELKLEIRLKSEQLTNERPKKSQVKVSGTAKRSQIKKKNLQERTNIKPTKLVLLHHQP